MTSKVARLVDSLADEIRSGRLPPGTLLPTHRELAARHGIAIATATRVYAQLQSMGLVIGETGRGTFVRDRPLQRSWDSADESRLSADAADLSFNHPTWQGQAELLRAMLRELSQAGDLGSLLHQQPPGGRRREREVIARFLVRHRGIPAEADRLFLVGGSQQAIDITLRALLGPRDAVAVDALTYPGFRMAATLQRLTLKPVSFTARGPDPDQLDDICRRGNVKAIYTMPTLHNPLSWVLSRSRREQLVDIARRRDCLLIEDASYAFLVGSAPPPLVAMAPERTIYLSSVSKSVASGLRFGYLLVPASLATNIRAAIRATFWSMPSLVTALASRWFEDGTVARQEVRMRSEARQRQKIAREVLAGFDILTHPSSLFLWLGLPEELRMDRIAMALAERNIAVSRAELYATTRHAPHALRLGLSSVSLDQLEPVLSRVRETIERFPV